MMVRRYCVFMVIIYYDFRIAWSSAGYFWDLKVDGYRLGR